MAVITEAAVRELAGFRGQGAPVTTCYLDVDGRRLSRHRDYEQEFDRILRSARVRANGNASVGQDLQRIEDYVKGGFDRSHTRGLAIFSCSDEAFWHVLPLPVPVRSRVIVNQAPAVSQLESLTQEFDRFGVLLADKQRARMMVFHFGELVDHSDLLDELPRDYDTRGHSDQGDVQRPRRRAGRRPPAPRRRRRLPGVPGRAVRAPHGGRPRSHRRRARGQPPPLPPRPAVRSHRRRRHRLGRRDPQRRPRRRARGRAPPGGRRGGPPAQPGRHRQPGRGRAGLHPRGPRRPPRRPAAGVGRLQRARLALRRLRPPRAGRAGLPRLRQPAASRSTTSSRRPSRPPWASRATSRSASTTPTST